MRDRAKALEAGSPAAPGPPKAVVTDQDWKDAAASGAGDDDMAAAQRAAADYGFNNPVADVLEYAEYLGMDVTADAELLWIADEALSAPDPQGWEQRQDPKGNVFFLHENTGTILTEHPLDHHYQQLYYQLKEKQKPRRSSQREADAPQDAAAEDEDMLHVDLGSLPASVLLSKATLKKASTKEVWGSLTTRKASRTHMLNLVTYEHTTTVRRPKGGGLGVGLTVDNIIVEMEPGGAFAQAGDNLQPYDKIVKIDGVRLGSRMLKDVVRPRDTHEVTVRYAREASLPKSGRDGRARALPPRDEGTRLKEYTLTIKRHKGSPGFTLDPTNLIIALEPGSDAATILKEGDKVVEVDGELLENVRFAEKADATKKAHKLRVCRLKGAKGAVASTPGSSGPPRKPSQQARIHFREVKLSKTSPDVRIGVLFHKLDDAFDTSSFQPAGEGALPIIKKVLLPPGRVGRARAGPPPDASPLSRLAARWSPTP